MNGLSYQETLTSEIFQGQTDEQLKFTLKTIEDDANSFQVVEYILTSVDSLGFVVKSDFYITALLNEMVYRGIL